MSATRHKTSGSPRKGDTLYAICLGWPGERWPSPRWQSLYPSEIASVTMLGVDEELPWTMTPDGFVIRTPHRQPCEHAFTFKIVRKHPFA